MSNTTITTPSLDLAASDTNGFIVITVTSSLPNDLITLVAYDGLNNSVTNAKVTLDSNGASIITFTALPNGFYKVVGTVEDSTYGEVSNQTTITITDSPIVSPLVGASVPGYAGTSDVGPDPKTLLFYYLSQEKQQTFLPDDYTVGYPQAAPLSSGRNTEVSMYPVALTTEYMKLDFLYNRIDLTQLTGLVLLYKDTYTKISDCLSDVNKALGVQMSASDIVDGDMPSAVSADGTRVFTIQMSDTNLIFVNTLTVTLSPTYRNDPYEYFDGKTAFAKLQIDLTTNVTDLQNQINAILAVMETSSDVDARIALLQDSIASLTTRVTAVETVASTNTTSIASINTQLTNLQTSLNTLTTQVNSNVSAITTLQTNMSTLQSSVNTLSNTVSTLNTQVTANTTSIASNQASINALTSTTNTLLSNVSSLTSTVNANNASISNIINHFPYDLAFSLTQQIAANTIVGVFSANRNFVIPANCVGSTAKAATLPTTSTAQFDMVSKNTGITFATVSITTAGVVTFTTVTGTSLNDASNNISISKGDVITLVSDATTYDASINNVGISIACTFVFS